MDNQVQPLPKTADKIFYNEEFTLVIRDRQTILYNGPAAAVTTKNDSGLLDILPEHTNFISIIKEFVKISRSDGVKKDFPIDTGVVKVEQNEVRIYLGIYTSSKK